MNANEWNLFILGRLVFALLGVMAGARPSCSVSIPFHKSFPLLFHFSFPRFSCLCLISSNWEGMLSCADSKKKEKINQTVVLVFSLINKRKAKRMKWNQLSEVDEMEFLCADGLWPITHHKEQATTTARNKLRNSFLHCFIWFLCLVAFLLCGGRGWYNIITVIRAD